MVIGGIWIPDRMVDQVRIAMKDIRYEYGVNWEFKWQKLSAVKVNAHKDMIDFFFAIPSISYRCIVIDKEMVDYSTFHNNDRELGFYKFYFFLISRALNPEIDYYAYLDDRANKKKNRLGDLKKTVNAWCSRQHRCDYDILHTVEPRSSYQEDLIQMADVFCGAIAGVWNCSFASPAKQAICDHISAKKKWPKLRVSTPRSEYKFNIWKWEPSLKW